MGITTSIDNYTTDQIEVSKQAKAMGHPARVAIMKLLSEKSLTCNAIVESMPLAQSTVSQHLKELKAVHLIDAMEVRPKIIYSLNKKNYQKFKNILEEIF
ncbi:MAG: winged helix-turn-helix domain-containing protein [Salinivirgaceae bacterium]|nr:winged helix-turn-helix domain-containing protein [Salinivirgaceae bacterium]